MPSAEYDLLYLDACIEQLEKYLLAKELYWPVSVRPPSGEPPYPQMTLGWLLLARRRAEATAQTASQCHTLEKLRTKMDVTRSRWRTAWSRKARTEFRARLNLWRDFLEEYRHQPAEHFDRFPYEVNRRVLLELLKPEIDDLNRADREMLSGLDILLKAIFVPGPFVWAPQLTHSFPPETFWYLYGSLPEHPKDSRERERNP